MTICHFNLVAGLDVEHFKYICDQKSDILQTYHHIYNEPKRLEEIKKKLERWPYAHDVVT